MKTWTRAGWILAGFLVLAGCFGCQGQEPAASEAETAETRTEAENIKLPADPEQPQKAGNVPPGTAAQEDVDRTSGAVAREPEILEADWSQYFDGLNGAAVLYDGSRYRIYNRELAEVRRSPCSTFKIISSLAALESGVLEPEDSTCAWSGEVFWNENWNRDQDFGQAFRDSCVWYFRRLIDETGQQRMQETLDQLSYGNGDISDWEGQLNTNNGNRALTGFWIESSLKISPREQTQVMERIFGRDSIYKEETREALRQVMLFQDQKVTELTIYGKTGMGKDRGVTVDAWYTGFAEGKAGRVYFCVYLGQTGGREVTSSRAREIAVEILSEEEPS
ncbi:MAG: class D beta-lactamase [Lachnospiraceae bacterium]|nr:class D beta-lactamase [Lachnospiraceae bacterium]